MTDATKYIPTDSTPDGAELDAQLQASLKDAYEQMGPSTQAQKRMLEALQQAQQHASDAQLKTEGTTTSTQRGKVLPFLRKHVVPVAASTVAVLMLAAGSWSVLQNMSTGTLNAPGQSESINATESASSAQDAESAAGIQMDSASKTFSAESMELAAEPNCYPYSSPVDDDGFIKTSDEPRSTVSSDVDTASYCRLRGMLNNDAYGLDELAYSDDVRTEEMLNYFTYEYPTPSGDKLFSMSAQAGTCPWDDSHELLVLGFNAAQKETTSAGSNLVFLIDVSGSMSDNDKLPLLKRSFEKLVDQLGANDRISIVTYSGEERVVLTGARGTEKASIMRAINSLEPSGMTNGEAGLKMAYSVARDCFIDGGVNRIVLATDGDLNVGISDEDELEKFIAGKRKSGIYLSVLGFGLDGYNDGALETLADNGNGQYHFIDCEQEAQKVLVNNLTKNFEPLANDVKMQIEFNPAQVAKYRLIGYENRLLDDEDFLDDTKDAGDVGARAQFTVAYELVMADGASVSSGKVKPLKYKSDSAGTSTTSSEWATCSLRYKPAGSKNSSEQQLVIDTSSHSTSPSDDWRFAACVIEYAEALIQGFDYDGSDEHAKLGSASKASLQHVRSTLQSMRLNNERHEFLELVEKTERAGSE